MAINRALNINSDAKNNQKSLGNNFGLGRKSDSSYEFGHVRPSDYHTAAVQDHLRSMGNRADSHSSQRPLHVKFESISSANINAGSINN